MRASSLSPLAPLSPLPSPQKRSLVRAPFLELRPRCEPPYHSDEHGYVVDLPSFVCISTQGILLSDY
ncbi:hypothetical protein OPV22_005314 [Ensete ventricosum]|uniref:Uncharacterized protein n=1 Tax=Ensete ventricosum TaxID=4639 RepID=A0AAV8RME3_ENSVE|nr:hypothetical protein OPV22_005314 [Ensete ventricosum]